MLLVAFSIGCAIGYFLRAIFFKSSGEVADASPEQAADSSKPPAKKSEAPSSASDGRPSALDGPRDGKKDNLKHIKGVGPKIETTLNELGIYHFDQIAGWDRKTINWVDNHLSFKGRIDREKWVTQAKSLAKGEDTEFSKRVAKGSVPSSRKKK